MTSGIEFPAIQHLPLEQIRVGPRHRHDMGDLQALADSISEIGLLQPIGVTADFALVFGERRLRAARILGWTTVPARIVDVPSIVAGEYAENEVRKGFTPSERVAIAGAIRAEIGSRQGQRTDRAELPQNIAEVGPGQETRDLAARKAGFGNRETYRHAKTVVERGAPNVVEAMDAGEVSISAAARAVKAAPKEKQSNWTVADIRRAAKEAAIGPVPLPTPRQAIERSRQTGALVLASDGKYHAFTTPEQDKAADAYRTLRFELLQDIPPIDPADAVAAVPEHMRPWVTARAAERLAWFERFLILWRERHAA
jgi:ParB family chromosome partitioning protein